MNRQTLFLRVIAGATGVLLVIVTIFYFAWATSIAQPVDWTAVASVAAFFAPLGLFAAVFVSPPR